MIKIIDERMVSSSLVKFHQHLEVSGKFRGGFKTDTYSYYRWERSNFPVPVELLIEVAISGLNADAEIDLLFSFTCDGKMKVFEEHVRHMDKFYQGIPDKTKFFKYKHGLAGAYVQSKAGGFRLTVPSDINLLFKLVKEFQQIGNILTKTGTTPSTARVNLKRR